MTRIRFVVLRQLAGRGQLRAFGRVHTIFFAKLFGSGNDAAAPLIGAHAATGRHRPRQPGSSEHDVNLIQIHVQRIGADLSQNCQRPRTDVRCLKLDFVATALVANARPQTQQMLVRVGRTRHAHTDPPLTVALRARRGVALLPAELNRAIAQTFHEIPRAEWLAVFRVNGGFVTNTQLDGIDADVCSEFVQRHLGRKHAGGLTRPAHEHADRYVERSGAMRGVEVRRGVHHARRGCGLIHVNL